MLTKKKDGLNSFQHFAQMFVPYNRDKHWSCLQVDFPCKMIRHYDNLHHTAKGAGGYLLRFLGDEAKRLNLPFNAHDWGYEEMTGITPRQPDLNSCGFYTMLSIFCLARGIPLGYASTGLIEGYTTMVTHQKKHGRKQLAIKARNLILTCLVAKCMPGDSPLSADLYM